jgi:hypothetical protein
MKDGGVITNDPNAYACDTWDILQGRILAYTRDVHLVATDLTNKVPPLCFEKYQAEIASLKAIIATRNTKDAKDAKDTANHKSSASNDPKKEAMKSG